MVTKTLMNTAATGRPKRAPAVVQGKLLQEEHHGVRNRMNELGVGPHPWVKNDAEKHDQAQLNHIVTKALYISQNNGEVAKTHTSVDLVLIRNFRSQEWG